MYLTLFPDYGSTTYPLRQVKSDNIDPMVCCFQGTVICKSQKTSKIEIIDNDISTIFRKLEMTDFNFIQ